MPEYQEKNSAIVFVTDPGFLVPSISAATQVANQHKVTSIADIYIILVDFEESVVDLIRSVFTPFGIKFLTIAPASFLPSDPIALNKTHVPMTTLGRLAIQEVIPSSIEHVLYIDGDVQILGDIFPLVSHRVKPGHIAAANESLWLCQNDLGSFWPRHKKYLDHLGIENPIDYFNAGVLAFRMDTWREMAPKALSYFTKNSAECLYHDQSALNAVFLGRREILSPTYNFNSFFSTLGTIAETKPKIAHFTGGYKPWFFPGPPWHGKFIGQYEELATKYDVLKPFSKKMPPEQIRRIIASERKSRFKQFIITPWRSWLRRREFLRYLQETEFSVT